MSERALDRTFPMALAAVALAAIGLALLLAPSGGSAANKRPPQIDRVKGIAEYVNEAGTVHFAVRVDRAKKVKIRYGGHGKRARRAEFLKQWWEAAFKTRQRKACYRLKVIAANKAGRVDRRKRACAPQAQR